MPKFDINKLNAIPEEKPLEINVVKTLSKLNAEDAGKTEEKKIKISFEFFDSKNKYFSLGDINSEWFTDLLEEFKELTKITKKQLFNEYKQKYKPHPYTNIDLLNYKDEYLINPQYDSVQIRLNKSSGRIHGFFIKNVYYIRFLDRRHNMYNSDGYGKVVFAKFPKTSIEILEEENEKQLEQILQLEQRHKNNAELICDNCLDCSKKICDKFEL